MATEQPSTSITDASQTLFKDSRADNRFGRLQTDLEANNTVAAVKLDLDDPVATGSFLASSWPNFMRCTMPQSSSRASLTESGLDRPSRFIETLFMPNEPS